jgi:RNA polymerase sigma factor (sigma-70 family)
VVRTLGGSEAQRPAASAGQALDANEDTEDIAALRSSLLPVASPRAGRHDAEDAVQEALFRACADPDVELVRAAGWLRVVTRNAAVDIARRRGRDLALRTRLETLQAVSPDHADDVVDRQLAVALQTMLDRLTAHQREVIRHVAGGRSVRAAAVEMGITERAAQGHLTRARRALRSWSS